MSKKRAKSPKKESSSPGLDLLERPWFLLTLLVIAVIVCFYPVTRYFFSQDDFALLFNSVYESASHFRSYFESDPGQFRPISKALYFTLMHGLFELNPTPYHFVSLFLYILNALLFYRLMTKFRIAPLPALATTAFFALSVAFLNVVAWISCIQPLLGELFLLLSMLFGIEALGKSSLKPALLSLVAYLLALMSMEQAYPIPILLALYAYIETPFSREWKNFLKSIRTIIPHFIVLFLYILFMLLWKHPPQEGSYAFHFGANVGANLLTYLDRMFSFSVLYPFVSNIADAGFTVSHLFILALILYNIMRRREKLIIFALIFYLSAILPTLFLQEHIYYSHLYIPAAGMFLLLALLINDFFDALLTWKRKAASLAVLFFVLILSLISFTKVRENENRFIRPHFRLPNNFVFRRATIAKNVWDDIKRKTRWNPENGALYMVALGDVSNWYGTNVIAALGGGDALKLLYKDPELDVFFVNQGDLVEDYRPMSSLIIFFDDYGRCYTLEEAEKSRSLNQQKSTQEY